MLRPGGGLTRCAHPARLCGRSLASLGPSPRFLFRALGTKSGSAGLRMLTMSIWIHKLRAAELSAQDRQSPHALVAARASPHKVTGLAIGAIACELILSAV